MDQVAKLQEIEGAEVTDIIVPTQKIFQAVLETKRSEIIKVPKKTFQYGKTDRHQLDIYYPLSAPGPNARTPILFYAYGGGFRGGHRNLAPPLDLIYSCVGAFFARQGFITIIPDYRLVPTVKYPEPAEDIRDAISWVVSHKTDLVSTTTPTPCLNSIFLMGHSAGAVHVATMILNPAVLPADSDLRPRIKGVILMGGAYYPHDFLFDVQAEYWGSQDKARDESVFELLFWSSHTLPKTPLPNFLIAEAEWEPPWVQKISRNLQSLLEWRLGTRVKKVIGKGHNHISFYSALSSGQGEEWGIEASDWIRDVAQGFQDPKYQPAAYWTRRENGNVALEEIETNDFQCPQCSQRKIRYFRTELKPERTCASCLECGKKWVSPEGNLITRSLL